MKLRIFSSLMEHNALTEFNLPNEAISHILLNLPRRDLFNCSGVNKLFYELSNQNFIWKNLYIRNYGVNIHHEGSWKELYKQDNPLLNLKRGRFVYRCLAKSVQMPGVNGDLERLYEFHGPFGVMNKTVNYRGSYSPSTTEASSLFDLNTFQHKPIRGVFGCHIKLVGKYWFLMAMEERCYPYSRGVTYFQFKILEATDLDSDHIYLSIDDPGVRTIEFDESLPRHTVWGEFSGTCFAYCTSKTNEETFAVEFNFVQFYDFAENATKIHEVKLPGDLLFFSDNYVGYITGKLGHSFMVYHWRSKADLESSVTFNVPNDHKIISAAEDKGRLVVIDESGHLTVFDSKNGQVLHHYNIEELTNYQVGVIRLVDNVCTLGLKKDRYTIGHAVIDIRTGHVIQTLNFGGRWGHIEPLRNELGKFSGKILVNCNDDVGIIDLTSPHIHKPIRVLSIPGNVESIEATKTAVKFHRVLYGKMWSDLAKLCECPAFNLDSQILIELKKKYRYIVVYNSVEGTSKQNVVLDKLFAECILQHANCCPVQGLSLDINQPPPIKPDFEYGDNRSRYRRYTKVWMASTLKGYGTAVLLKEVWSESNGWIPAEVPKDLSLNRLLKSLFQSEDVDWDD